MRSSGFRFLLGLATLCVVIVLLVRTLGCLGPSAATETGDGPPAPLLLISIDGFWAGYLDRVDTPNLDRLIRGGVRAEGLIPSFPTKTFPNHYSIVTGLYPEHHGIVSNTMYDPEFDAGFSLSNREAIIEERWWGGEPIWVTAEKAGLVTATYFWPGSEAPIQGVRPTFWETYDTRVPHETRIAQVLSWLDLPAGRRPSFLTVYFSDVDSKGHSYGPEAPETEAALRTMDADLGTLLDGLQARDLLDAVNLIVVSDHGMVATSRERVIFLDDYIDLDRVDVVDWSPVTALRPLDGETDRVYEALAGAHPHFQVYRKDDLPARLHYQAHRRIAPIIGMADEGWSVTTRASFDQNPDRFEGGSHGYDNRLPSMHAIFIAHGPAFRENLTVEPFANIHLYHLMAALLHLNPAPNDGDARLVQALLK